MQLAKAIKQDVPEIGLRNGVLRPVRPQGPPTPPKQPVPKQPGKFAQPPPPATKP